MRGSFVERDLHAVARDAVAAFCRALHRRYDAGEHLVADRAHGDLRLLPILHGENIRLVHAHGELHARIRREREELVSPLAAVLPEEDEPSPEESEPSGP